MQSFILRNNNLKFKTIFFSRCLKHLHLNDKIIWLSQFKQCASKIASFDAKSNKLDLEKYLPIFSSFAYRLNSSINLFKSTPSLNSQNNQQNNQEKTAGSNDSEQDANKNNMRSPGNIF